MRRALLVPYLLLLLLPTVLLSAANGQVDLGITGVVVLVHSAPHGTITLSYSVIDKFDINVADRPSHNSMKNQSSSFFLSFFLSSFQIQNAILSLLSLDCSKAAKNN